MNRRGEELKPKILNDICKIIVIDLIAIGWKLPIQLYQIRRISRQKSKFVKMDATLSGRTTAVKVIEY